MALLVIVTMSLCRSRGLGQLVRARNIHTIGDLSALTEAQIDGLPIKAPKVLTVKKVLGNFSDTQLAKKSKIWKLPKAPKAVVMLEGRFFKC